MRTRSWEWLRQRMKALLELPPVYRPDGVPMHATRLGNALYPPQEPKGR